ncbi:MAG: hypothetical protein IJX77_07285 [Ruminococcus sp.]|nr:hypothetical protein [Ruminococcus sp.]
MKTKKIFACLLASVMMCGFASCSEEKEEKTSEESSVAEEATEAVTTEPVNVDAVQAETPEFEEAIAAESGDAYLAMVDSQWWIQYWGKVDDGSPLAYDAGVVPITGDGDYTVSVNADTNGFRFDTTGDANGECIPSGCGFAAVMVKDGVTKYPNMAIEITSIRVNGTEVPMTAKNYTSTDDGIEMRANIYNEWVSEVPEDAHDANGPVTDNDTYKAQIVDPAVFADGWTSVEVDFTVTGTGV